MVRTVLFIISFLFSFGLHAQRLNFSLNGGWMLSKSTTNVYQERPYQILYAAPYTTTSGAFEFAGVENDQVRIARIWGVKPYNNTSISLGGEWTYVFKNHWRIAMGTGFYKDADQIFYSFQNMLVNLDPKESSSNANSPENLDEDITIHRWMNTFGLRGIYELPTPTLLKGYLSLGYQFRYQMFSYYDSELTEQNVEEYSGVYLNEYYNINVFQERLYRENAAPGFSHFVQAGVGLRRYGFAAELNFNFSPMGTNDKYNSQYFFQFNLQYDILNFELFQ